MIREFATYSAADSWAWHMGSDSRSNGTLAIGNAVFWWTATSDNRAALGALR